MFVDFVNRYRAKSTRALYVSAWVKFLSLVYSARLAGTSPELLEPWVAKYANDLRNGRRDLASDLRILEEQVRSPKTCQTYRSAIRTLLATVDLSPPPGSEGRPEKARSEPPSQAIGGTLSAGKILRLLEHLDTRGRAILYVLVASGARPGEVLSLRTGDLDLGSRPARFRVRDSSGRVSRIAFLSREAVGAIRVYLIVRDRFVASAQSRGSTRPPDLLFPLGPRAFGEVWALALEKAGLAEADPATG
ncbi:MAG TPA: site-specific integrase, partial [Methanomicrobiales archaeon]|nr:site-specific integrase [Methanomicrobiales archaeon]